DDGAGRAGVEVEVAVAGDVDGAVVRQHGAVLHVEVEEAGDVDGAVVRDGTGIEEGVAGHADGGGGGDRERAAAGDVAAGPGHGGGAGEVDVGAAAQHPALHRERGDRLRPGAVDGERAAGDGEVRGDRAGEGVGAALHGERAAAADAGGGVEGAGVVGVQSERGAVRDRNGGAGAGERAA